VKIGVGQDSVSDQFLSRTLKSAELKLCVYVVESGYGTSSGNPKLLGDELTYFKGDAANDLSV